MDRGAWRATVHGVAKSQTQLSGWDFMANKPESSCPESQMTQPLNSTAKDLVWLFLCHLLVEHGARQWQGHLEFYKSFLFGCLSWLNVSQYRFCFDSWPWGTRDLGSPTRDQTHIPHTGRWSLAHWTSGEVPRVTENSKRRKVSKTCPKAFIGETKGMKNWLSNCSVRDYLYQFSDHH